MVIIGTWNGSRSTEISLIGHPAFELLIESTANWMFAGKTAMNSAAASRPPPRPVPPTAPAHAPPKNATPSTDITLNAPPPFELQN